VGYVEAANQPEPENVRLTRVSVTYEPFRLLVASRAEEVTTLERVAFFKETRREEISSYLELPLRDSQGTDHLVDFSVFAPMIVVPASSFLLDVWAYLPFQREDMLARASRQQRKVEIGSRGGVVTPVNIQLSMALHLDWFVIDKPQEWFYWSGHASNVSFLVTAPPELVPATYPNGMLIAQLHFEIVARTSGTSGAGEVVYELEEKERRIRSAFASYSSKDRQEVLQRVQGITAVGVDVFMDVLSLRAGQLWEQRLIENMKKRDAFYRSSAKITL
jgi:hypothetical protein